jgi:hypothetical protein
MIEIIKWVAIIIMQAFGIFISYKIGCADGWREASKEFYKEPIMPEGKLTIGH